MSSWIEAFDERMTLEILVDSNVILDVLTVDRRWFNWSDHALRSLNPGNNVFVINPIIYEEVSIGFDKIIEDLEEVLDPAMFRRVRIPWEAAFLAGKCFLKYRRQGGKKDGRKSREGIAEIFVYQMIHISL